MSIPADAPYKRNKDEVARDLIRWHFYVDPLLIEIYRIRSAEEHREEEPIKILEVTRESSETGRVDPFLFGPKDDVTYPTAIAEVSQRELQLIRLGLLGLPEGWDLAKAERYRPEDFPDLDAAEKTGT